MAALNLIVAFNFPTDTWVNFKLFGGMGLLIAFAMLSQRRILSLIHLFAWQGVALAASTLIVAYTTGQAHLYWGNTVLKHARLKASLTELDGAINVIPVERFTEAPYVHERQGVYYLSYATGWPEEIAYLTAPSPEGPWTPRGRIMETNAGTKTIHQAIFDFNGRSYIA